jgi:hypothetical protein
MNLNPDDFEMVINLMTGLHIYTALEQGILKSPEEYNKLVEDDESHHTSFELRDILFSNPTRYIDNFIQENQGMLSPEEVEILHSWKLAIKGNFFVERHLKKHSIFVQIGDNRHKAVYAVLGLDEPLSECFPNSCLPLIIETVLLPFKNQIITDGLFLGGSIFFGNGIKNELKRGYMNAKQQGTIIFDLQQPVVLEKITDRIAVLEQPWKAEITQIVALTKKLRGGKGQPVLNSSVFSLLKASAEFAELVVNKPEDALAIEKFYAKLERLCYKLETEVYEHTSTQY